MATMPEEIIRGAPAAQYRGSRFPNFVGGTGDPNQPGVATPVPAPTTPAGGGGGTSAPKPVTKLGQVSADRPEGGGTQDNRTGDRNMTPEGTEKERDKYGRGRAALTAKNVARGLSFGLGIGPLTPASIVANEAVEAITGEDIGMGLPKFDEFQAPDKTIQGQIGTEYTTANEAYAAQDAQASNPPTGGGIGSAGWGAPGATQPRDEGGGGGADQGGEVGSTRSAPGTGHPGQAPRMAHGGTVIPQGVSPISPPRAVPFPPPVKPKTPQRYEMQGYDPYEFVGDMATEIIKRPAQTWTPEEQQIMQEFQSMGGQMPEQQRPPLPMDFQRAGPVQQPLQGGTAGLGFLRAPPVGAASAIYMGGGTVMPRRPGCNAGGVVRGRTEGRMAYNQGGPVIDPAAVPDDGVLDNQPINADEGEFVITRDAAVALGPEVLAVINDPQMAPMMRDLVMQVLASQGRSGDGEQPDAGNLMPARPTTRLGNLRG